MAPLKERAAADLRRHFEESRIDLGELELRLGKAQRATDVAGVEEALSGLQVPAPPALPVPVPTPVLVPELVTEGSPRPGGHNVVAVLSNVTRHGSWEAVGAPKVVTVMGSATLDLRDAQLPPGCTEIRCVAVMGSIEIIVPPNLYVDTGGVGVMGSFESTGITAPQPRGDTPWLRITGAAVFGSVEVVAKGPPDERLAQIAALGTEALHAVVEKIATVAGVKKLPRDERRSLRKRKRRWDEEDGEE